jgi:hypothetical protein
MPDSYGKRQRNAQKARKFAAREERRAARKQQRADEAAGIVHGTGSDESEPDKPGADSQAEPGSSEPGSDERSEPSEGRS